MKELNKRWKGSVALSIFMLAVSTNPSAARLDEGKFIPFSQAVSSIADRQNILYRIEKGDTLYGIAREYDVSLDKLMLTNKMNEKTILEIGATIQIPAYQGPIHIVAPGETISALAERYQIGEEELINANLDIDPSSLEVGECLRIPANEVEWLEESTIEPSRGTSQRNTLSWPITGEITCPFGSRKSGFHHGIDIAADIGDPICAAASGTVSWAGYMSVYGRCVIINHADGKQTLYAHASKLLVKKGERINRGERIALIGISGVTTGPHLHFEVRVNKKAQDPLNYLR
ncbi:MAG: M23 family metallopeptidase [Syntrophomonadaceae bacterium]|nr:M23 family metallopeptidase [Syntrophomonadaceae bacterium]